MTKFTLPALPYAYDALAPYMSRETLEFHHDKHHKAYVDKANELVADSDLSDKTLEEIIRLSYKDQLRVGIYNQAGQHWNHAEFWKYMKPEGGGRKLPAAIEKAIVTSFGSFDKFKADFTSAGVSQFGSGWSWLVLEPNGSLSVMKTSNADSPLAMGKHAILCADVWEHTYYIDYRNARSKYLDAFVDNLINWDYVLERYEAGQKA